MDSKVTKTPLLYREQIGPPSLGRDSESMLHFKHLTIIRVKGLERNEHDNVKMLHVYQTIKTLVTITYRRQP